MNCVQDPYPASQRNASRVLMQLVNGLRPTYGQASCKEVPAVRQDDTRRIVLKSITATQPQPLLNPRWVPLSTLSAGTDTPERRVPLALCCKTGLEKRLRSIEYWR